MELQFRVYGKIARPVAEVFDAVYNPTKLSGYFTTGGASAPLVEGSTVTWDFADFPGAFPVQVRTVDLSRELQILAFHEQRRIDGLGPAPAAARVTTLRQVPVR